MFNQGWDDISLTLKHDDEISTFEKHRKVVTPWLEGIGSGDRIPVPFHQSQSQGKMDW